tara:strand:- start:203 stop:391 length:189 start_codon:yes stop_codon:yes gene_type:complete
VAAAVVPVQLVVIVEIQDKLAKVVQEKLTQYQMVQLQFIMLVAEAAVVVLNLPVKVDKVALV